MKKEIVTLIFAVFLIGIVSAHYPGDSFYVSNNLHTTNLNYTIIDNSTPVEGIDFEIGINWIKINLPTNLPPGSFSILFISKDNYKQMRVKVRRPFWYSYYYFYPRRNWFYWWRGY